MALELTADGINEFYDVIHGIDNSLDHIHNDLNTLNDTMADVVAQLENLCSILSNSNSKDS